MSDLSKKLLLSVGTVFGVVACGLAVTSEMADHEENYVKKHIDREVRALSPINPRLNPAIASIFNNYRKCIERNAGATLRGMARDHRLAPLYDFVPLVAEKRKESSLMREATLDLIRLECRAQSAGDQRRTFPVYRLPPLPQHDPAGKAPDKLRYRELTYKLPQGHKAGPRVYA